MMRYLDAIIGWTFVIAGCIVIWGFGGMLISLGALILMYSHHLELVPGKTAK